MQTLKSLSVNRSILLLSLCMVLIALTTLHTNSAHPMTTAAELHAMGGSQNCDFANGVSLGLGVASLFGCVVCGFASLGIAAVTTFAC